MSDARSAIFQELRSQFDGLLPPSVILDCVDHAVQHLLGSISAEALTEMAIRLATVCPEHRIRATDQSPGAVKNTMARAPPFTVIRPPAPGYPPLVMTVTTTGTTSELYPAANRATKQRSRAAATDFDPCSKISTRWFQATRGRPPERENILGVPGDEDWHERDVRRSPTIDRQAFGVDAACGAPPVSGRRGSRRFQ